MNLKNPPPANVVAAEGENLLVGQRHGAKAEMSICGINDNYIVEEKSRMSSQFTENVKDCKPVVNNELEQICGGFCVEDVRKVRMVCDVNRSFEEACMASEEVTAKSNFMLSMFQFPQAFLDKLEETKSAAGYKGIHWGPFLWIDIDREGDLQAAVNDTVRLVKNLVLRFQIDAANLQIWFSGKKGFHIGLPIELFGEAATPCEGFGSACKAVAERLGKEAGVVIDNQVYDRVRLFRCPNTRHKETRLYKIPVTLAELESENAVDMILHRAKQPRRLIAYETLVGDDVTYCPTTACINTAVKMWNDAINVKSGVGYTPYTSTPYYGQQQIRRSTQDFLTGNVKQGSRAVELFKASADMYNNGYPAVTVKSQLTPTALKIGLEPQETARQIECGINAAKRSGERMASIAPQDLAMDYINSIPPLSRVYHAGQWHTFQPGNGWRATGDTLVKADVTNFLRTAFNRWTAQRPNVTRWLVQDVMDCGQAMLIVALPDEDTPDTAVWLRQVEGVIHTENAEGWIATQSHFIHVPTVALALHRRSQIPVKAILPADSSLFTLGVVPCIFDVNSQCPRWEQFTQESCPGDATMLHQMFGLSLTYDRKYNVFFTLAGEAGTGKSTALNVLASLNTATTCGVSLGEFGERFKKYPLTKNRVNLVQDMASVYEGTGNATEREAVLKSLTAGEKIEVEQKHKPSEYRFLCALPIFGCNTLPRFADRSEAISDRMRIISFPNKFRGTNAQDLSLGQRLNDELPGILIWALKGYGALLDSGLPLFPETPYSQALKADNIKAARPVELFCDEMLEKVDSDAKWQNVNVNTPTMEVYGKYKEFCAERGYKPASENRVTPEIAKYMDVEKTRKQFYGKQSMCFVGVIFAGCPSLPHEQQ